MSQNIQVRCLINRFWQPSTKDWGGDWVNGTFIDVSTQTAEEDTSKQIPVAIVMLEDNTFQCVPMMFVYKQGV